MIKAVVVGVVFLLLGFFALCMTIIALACAGDITVPLFFCTFVGCLLSGIGLLLSKKWGTYSAIVTSVLILITIFTLIFQSASNIAVDVPEFSPDGQNMILGIRARQDSGIYTIKLEDFSFKRIVNLPSFDVVCEPAYSPDGKKIVFRAIKRGDKNNHIFLINGDASTLKQLTYGDKDDIYPVFARDAKKIFFIRGIGEDGSALCSLSLDDLKVENISRYWSASALSVSPDGQYLFGLASRSGEKTDGWGRSICRIALNNNYAEDVFRPYIAEFNPVQTRVNWSSLRGKASALPDSQELVVGGFLKLENLRGVPINDSYHMIFRYNPVSNNVQKIIETTSWYGEGPNVSPDGKKMVFCTGSSYSCDSIYIANTDGSDLKEIKVKLE